MNESILQYPFILHSEDMQDRLRSMDQITFFDFSAAIKADGVWCVLLQRSDGDSGEAGHYCEVWNAESEPQ